MIYRLQVFDLRDQASFFLATWWRQNNLNSIMSILAYNVFSCTVRIERMIVL